MLVRSKCVQLFGVNAVFSPIQECGNTMSDLSNMVPFHSGLVKKLLFSCPRISIKQSLCAFLYSIFC